MAALTPNPTPDPTLALTPTPMQDPTPAQTPNLTPQLTPVSLVMMEYLKRNPLLILKKLIVDLGADTGVMSIAVAILGSRHIVCTNGTASMI